MPDIFLSYNREDQAVARLFAEAFSAQGFEVWWDAGLKTGEAYDEVTENALRTAKAVVVLWSKKSVVSRWVRAEATLADRQRTLVPAMIEPCDRPIMFELTQTAELSHWRGETTDRVWLGFLADVARFVGRQAAPVVPTTSPITAGALATAASARRSGRPSVAIMPFVNRSTDRADEVFAGGMSEDVAAALSLGRGLKVISQSATMAYRKDASDLRRIGQELDARYILEGNTRRVGQTLRVTAQVVEADTGAILWTQKFDRPLTELAELQEELVEEVAANLGVQIQKVEMERALKKPGDLTAWECVMRSWAAYARQTPESMASSVMEARRAVALAPDYAVARGTLAMALAVQFAAIGFRDNTLIEEALRHAEEALRLNSNHASVLFQVANTYLQSGRYDEMLLHAEQAVELNSSLVDARQVLACALIHFERYEEGLAQLTEGERLAPRAFQQAYAHGHRSWAYYGLGQLEAALDGCRRFEQQNPGAYWGQLTSAVCLYALGRTPEAQDAIRRTQKARPGEPLEFWINCIRHTYFAADKKASFEKHFLDAWNATPEDGA